MPRTRTPPPQKKKERKKIVMMPKQENNNMGTLATAVAVKCYGCTYAECYRLTFCVQHTQNS